MSYFEPNSRRSSTPLGQAPVPHEEERRGARSTTLGVGTLACPSCDAPIAIGPQRLALTAELTCPFCAEHGAVRSFLSLAPPTRPTRVVVRVRAPLRLT